MNQADFNVKLSYSDSFILISVIVIIILICYTFISSTIENLTVDKEIKIKSPVCDNCTLYGNQKNSFLNIYRESLNNRIRDWSKENKN